MMQIKIMFALAHLAELQQLTITDKHEYRQLLELWRSWIQERPVWHGMMDAAARADYAQVARQLTARLE